MSGLFRVALVVITVTVSMSAVAQQKDITFLEPVTVGGMTLAPGQYVIEWTGTGADVQVTFWRNSRKVVTVAALLRSAQHPYDAVTVRPERAGVNALLQIDFRDSELRFKPRQRGIPIARNVTVR